LDRTEHYYPLGGEVSIVSKPRKRTTESITLRVESSILNEIRREAELKLESPNTLINQILKQYTKWYAHAPNAGIFYISRSLIISLLQKYSDKEILQLSDNEIKNHFKDFYFMFQEECNIEKVLELLDYYARASGFNYKHRIEENNHTLVIQLDMGEKVSLLLSSLIRNVFQTLPLAPSSHDIQESKDAVIIRVKP
jgi:hypothetical protein